MRIWEENTCLSWKMQQHLQPSLDSVPIHILCQHLLFSTNLPFLHLVSLNRIRAQKWLYTLYALLKEQTSGQAADLRTASWPHLSVINRIQFTILQERGIFHSMLSCTDVPRSNILTSVCRYNLRTEKKSVWDWDHHNHLLKISALVGTKLL